MDSYGSVRRHYAVNETVQFWNVHRIWSYFVVPASGLILGVVKRMFAPTPHLFDVAIMGLIWAICFFVVSWVGSFFINYIWCAPAALHKEQQNVIASLTSSITDQETAKENTIVALKATIANQEQALAAKDEAFRRKHGVDEDRENEVKRLLTNFTPHEINVLRLLLRIGEVSEGTFSTAEDRRAIEKGKGCSLVKERTERTPGGNYIFFSIKPSLEDALKNVLHPLPVG